MEAHGTIPTVFALSTGVEDDPSGTDRPPRPA
jgi:hypothetical protein